MCCATDRLTQTTEKNNKRVKGAGNPLLTVRRLKFERVRALWADKVGTWLAIDMEAWERDHSMVTEFGWSRIRWQDDELVEDKAHWIVNEYKDYRNGTFVKDRRMVGSSDL